MPPIRHHPSHRVHDCVKLTDPTLQPTAETSSPSGDALRTAFQKQHLSPIWNGHQVTPAAHYLLINGVNPSVLHDFSPILVHDAFRNFEPSSSLPLPPKPYDIHDSPPAQLTRRAAGPSHPSTSSTSSPFSTPSPAPSPPISKLHIYSSTATQATADALPTVCTYQPSAQPPRPSNNFVLFRADYFARVHSLHLSRTHYASLPKVNSIWNQAPDAVKSYYRELAGLTKEVHGRLHPDYKYKPRKKDEMQRQKDGKARLKRETMARAKACRMDKAQAKSSTTLPAGNVVSVPKVLNAVDFRIYDPACRTYHRSYSSEVRSSPLSSPIGAPSTSPSQASSSSLARSGARNAAQFKDTDHLPSDSPSRNTSPASTLFRADRNESPHLENPHGTTDKDTEGNELYTAALRSAIEDDIDWSQIAPPHWCKPYDHRLFSDNRNACDNCATTPWSDERNVDIPTALASPTECTFRDRGYSFAVDPIPHVHSQFMSSAETSSFTSESTQVALASTKEADGDGELVTFWNGFFAKALHGHLPPSSEHQASPNVYIGYA